MPLKKTKHKKATAFVCFSSGCDALFCRACAGVIPYKDHPWQSGRLPPRMRMLAQEGRLMCLRWKYLKEPMLYDASIQSVGSCRPSPLPKASKHILFGSVRPLMSSIPACFSLGSGSKGSQGTLPTRAASC